MKNIFRRSILLGGALCMCSAGLLKAQSFVSPTLPDQFLSNVTTTTAASGGLPNSSADDVTINCDMLSDANARPIKAIAWDEGTASMVTHLYFEDGNGNIATLQFAGVHPDIVLGDSHDNPGVDYRAAVVYINGTPRINFYDLTNLGTTSFTATYAGTVQLSTNSVGTVYSTSDIPHIDMWSNNAAGAQVNGYPSMREFAVTWEEGSQGDIRYNWGDITTGSVYLTSPGAPVNANLPASSRRYTDVACYTDITTSPVTQYAAFTYADGSNVEIMELDFTNFSSPTPTGASPHTIFAGTTNIFTPRIEAMSQWDNPNLIPWEVVVSIGGVCYEYNSTVQGSDISTSLLAGGNFRSTAIAAGIGDVAGEPNIGNVQYTLGYFEWTGNPATPGTPNYYARAVDAVSGAVTDPDYYIINTGTVFGMNSYYLADVSKSLALSNCSNSGDYLLSVWYDGDDVSAVGSIWYKVSGNSTPMQFKTSRPVANLDGSAKLYPNPATDKIFLTNAKGMYHIVNVMGIKVIEGELNQDESIEISILPIGMYVLYAAGKAHKFTKR